MRRYALGFALIAGAALLARRLQPLPSLQGEVALITGGSRGLGLLLAREFAREGCRIAICARDIDELALAQEQLAQQGAVVLPIECDVRDQTQVSRMIEIVSQHYGQIDILINNAATLQVGPLSTMMMEDFQDAMNVIFWGGVYPTLAVLPQMRQRGRGRIVNITSIGGKVAIPHMIPYTAAKFAATGFSQALRAELMQDGITVTTIVPGLMRTGAHLNAQFKGRREEEFTWFALGDTLPGVSMSAETAARQIVEAVKRGDAERILSLPANLSARLFGLVPGTATNLMALADRFLLPGHDGGTTRAVSGERARMRLNSPLLNALIGLGQAAAARLNPYSRTW